MLLQQLFCALLVGLEMNSWLWVFVACSWRAQETEWR